MHRSRRFQRSRFLTRTTGYACPLCALLALLCCSNGAVPAQQPNQKASRFPYAEKLSYHIEWRLVTAGSATVETSHIRPDDWETKLNLQSEGLVTRLYRVLDSYNLTTDEKFCAANSVLDAQEGKRHTLTRLTFERERHRVDYDERDLIKNSTVKKELEAPSCTYEVAGALEALRAGNLQPGKWSTLPITNGKKVTTAKIEGQGRETLNLQGKTYQTIRYEVFLFDNVLYKRKGRMLIWITDDSDRVPVQIRLQMGFPIGNIVVQLDKQQRT